MNPRCLLFDDKLGMLFPKPPAFTASGLLLSVFKGQDNAMIRNLHASCGERPPNAFLVARSLAPYLNRQVLAAFILEVS